VYTTVNQQMADGNRVHGHAGGMGFGQVECRDKIAQQVGLGEKFVKIRAFRGSQLAGHHKR